MEENELNFFIKYGELGSEADVRDAYMKQKHRMIWERRNPEVTLYLHLSTMYNSDKIVRDIAS